ncbi:MAG: Fic family protein [Candidatus Micrarchaeota archaeon]
MKYIKKKLIRGNEYFYFEYPLFTSGKKGTFTRYLGREIPSNLGRRLENFFEEIAAISVKEVSNKFFLPNLIELIEKARFRYILLNHELFSKDFQLFKTLFYILFVLNSNRSEGSKVTRPDIEKVLKRQIKPKTLIDKEVVNSMEAINFALSREMKWNEKSIKGIHKNLFYNIHPEIAGQYKKVDNVIGNSSTTSWREVRSEMKKLLFWLKRNKKAYGPEVALEFHWRFEAIHPFEDGNGRVGRILLNAMLIKFGYSPVIFFSENHGFYCNAIEKAREGRKMQLAKHFAESVKKTENAIQRYKAEGIITGGSSKVGKWEIQKGKIRLM